MKLLCMSFFFHPFQKLNLHPLLYTSLWKARKWCFFSYENFSLEPLIFHCKKCNIYLFEFNKKKRLFVKSWKTHEAPFGVTYFDIVLEFEILAIDKKLAYILFPLISVRCSPPGVGAMTENYPWLELYRVERFWAEGKCVVFPLSTLYYEVMGWLEHK